jgi:hypothetical protein
MYQKRKRTMRNSVWAGFAAILTMTAICSETVPAQSLDESQLLQLQTLRRNIDKDLEQDAGGQETKFHADVLARQFSVAPSIVEDLRSKKQGWGTIAIELAMAQHLSRLDPISYRTVSEALEQVRAMRSDGKGWGAISRELGFKLGPIIIEMRHVREDLQIERERLKDQLKAERSMGITAHNVQLAMETADKTARRDRSQTERGGRERPGR